ncbi:hypothetical protein VdG1_00622 [Verticillium dahliae VDG1]|nr:hypothetical protein VdG1_00622 [Verticillium dahliae VDG1]
MYRHASRPLLGLGRPSLAVMSRQQARTYAKKDRPNANRAALRANQRVNDTAATAQSGNMMKQQKEAIEQATTRYAGSLFPGTFIPDTMIQQAVVAVDSTQRLDRVDVRTGLSIPGAARVQRRTEYLAITRRWNGSTYVAGDWKVIGNASETTSESWAQEQARIAAMEAENADKKLREAGIQ